MQLDNCSICKGRILQEETEFIAHVENQVIVIKNVPAWVCDNCGEAYFSPNTSRKIDIVMKDFHSGKILIKPLAAGEISLKK